MNDSTHNPASKFVSSGHLKRRRVLPLASTAAALGLAGCGMMGGGSTASAPVIPETPSTQPAETAPANPTLSARQRAAEQLVQNYTNNFELALDQIDRERLRAGERKIAATAPAPQPPAAMPAATLPAASPAAATPLPPVVAAPKSAASMGSTAAPSPALSALATPMASTQPSVILASAAPAPWCTLCPLTRLTNPRDRPAAVPVPVAAGMSSDKVSTAVITPIVTPTASASSAMGSMTAVAAPERTIDLATPTPVAPVANGGKPEPSPVATPAAVSAMTPVQEPSLDEALAIVRKRALEHPSLNTALALALLNSDPQSKPEDFAKSLPDADQKVFTDLLGALERMNAPAVATATLADRAAPLVQAAEKWQADADLVLPRLVLATRVDSFGVFTTIEPKFEQGKRQTVIIYCEVANFGTKKADDGWYTTSLTQQETLITDDGLMVWRPNAEEVEDRSMNQRKDFYLVKKLTIPESLAAGKYTLRMKVTDRNTGKTKDMGLAIEIVGK